MTLSSTPNKTRTRRTRAEMERIREGLYEILATGERPMTVRQVFYRAVVRHLVSKAEYDGTVVRLLAELRRAKVIPYEWIADSTRWMRKAETWSSTEEWLAYQARTFRRAIWDAQDVRVEVWCESNSLAGVLIDVTAEWDVPLYPCGGQPSISFMHSAGMGLVDEYRPVHVYYVGDYDGAGMDIGRRVETEIRGFAPDVDLHFKRIAVTTEQVEEMKLPTRPPNKKDVKRGWTECVEAEAIDPSAMRAIVNDCIVQHIDNETYQRVMLEQQATRDTLKMLARNGLPMTRGRIGGGL